LVGTRSFHYLAIGNLPLKTIPTILFKLYEKEENSWHLTKAVMEEANKALALAFGTKSRLDKEQYLYDTKSRITSCHNREFFQELLMSLNYKTMGFLVGT
jgi:hypothetical protein